MTTADRSADRPSDRPFDSPSDSASDSPSDSASDRPPGRRTIGSGPVAAVAKLLAGAVMMLVGLFYAVDGWPAVGGYGDAREAPATVVAVRYVKPQLRQGAEEVQLDVHLPTGVVPVEADPVSTAPDGLRPGDRVTVRYDPAHPGRAMFPVGPTRLVGGVALMLFGAVFVVGGLQTVRVPAPAPARPRYDEW